MYTTEKGSYKLEIISDKHQRLLKDGKLIKVYTHRKSASKAFHRLALKEELSNA